MVSPSHAPNSDLGSDSDSATGTPTDDSRESIAAYTTCPGRLVFVEAGNSDGWLATDLAVKLER